MVLFDFNNYVCKTCFSIDYEEEQEEDQEEDQNSRIWTRKKNGQSTKFSLDNLPVKLLTLIFKKMDQRSFVRMRRTNKKMSEFIQTYRDALRFSLFHLSRITFHPSKDDPDDAQVSFSCPPQNFEEVKDMDMNFAIYESLEGFEKTDFDQFTGMVKTEIRHHDYNDDDRDILGLPMVTISLKQWKNCADLQRELIGVYHHTRITFGRFLSVTAIELVCEFINFAGLKGNKLEVRSISDEILSVLCEKSEAIGLLDRNSRHSQELFTQNGFQTLKELTLLECPVVPKFSQLPNLETIYISVDMRSFNDDTKDSYGQIFECVNKWKNGEMALKELVFAGYSTDIDVTDFHGTFLPSHKVYETLIQFGFDTPATPVPPPVLCTKSARRSPTCSIKTSGGMDVCLEVDEASVLRCEIRDKTAIIFCGECGYETYTIYFKEK